MQMLTSLMAFKWYHISHLNKKKQNKKKQEVYQPTMSVSVSVTQLLTNPQTSVVA